MQSRKCYFPPLWQLRANGHGGPLRRALLFSQTRSQEASVYCLIFDLTKTGINETGQ